MTGGHDHGVAVLGDGSAWAWGSNDYGQVGDGTITDRTAPVKIIASGIADVAAGAHHSYALRTAGTVASWGRNYRSELGDGTGTQRAYAGQRARRERRDAPSAPAATWASSRWPTAGRSRGATTSTGSSVTAPPPTGPRRSSCPG